MVLQQPVHEAERSIEACMVQWRIALVVMVRNSGTARQQICDHLKILTSYCVYQRGVAALTAVINVYSVQQQTTHCTQVTTTRTVEQLVTQQLVAVAETEGAILLTHTQAHTDTTC